MRSARWTSGRSSCGSSHSRVAHAVRDRDAELAEQPREDRHREDGEHEACRGPTGARNRPWRTTSSSASGVESPRKRRISIAFEPDFFAAGTSGARTSSGLTGGVTLDAAASFEVASTAAPALSGPIARIDYRRGRGKRIAGDYPRLVAVNAEQRTMRRVVWSLWLLVGGLAIAAVAVYLATRGSDKATAPVVPVSSEAAATWPALRKPAPAFSLRDEEGRSFSLASLRGRPVVVTFIDPLCRDYCPTEAQRLTDVERALTAGAEPAIVAVSASTSTATRAHILLQDRAKWKLASEMALGRSADRRALAASGRRTTSHVLATTKKIAGVKVHRSATPKPRT